MKVKLLIAACIVSTAGAIEVIHSSVAEAQQVLPGLCQTAFAFQTNNDFGDCVPSISINTNPTAPVQVYARRADLQLARSEAQYNSTFAANYTRWLAQNGISNTVAVSSIQCAANTNGPAAYLCQPQSVASQRTRSGRVSSK